ncbi:polymer-forming cytoskeletal protein [Alphaproteobacteria bacterium]|nr:polymer-forming cytoskeletal protein [Alphaproteobacteria bacterium]
MFHRVKSETQPEKVEAVRTRPAQEASSRGAEDSVKPSPVESHKASTASRVSRVSQSSSSPVQKTQSYLQVSNTQKEEDVKTMSDTISSSEKSSRSSDAASTSPYQRSSASHTPAGVTGYTPSYTSPYSQPSATSTPSATDTYAGADRRLAIGRGITMSGEIESCDHLFVEGTVEAALKGAQVLEIAESGVFYGTVEIQDATIAGRFEGEIMVAGRLTIESTGVITGTISYGELQVESGAVIDGRLTPASAVAKTSSKSSSPAAAEKKVSADSGLFQEA